MKSSSTLTIIQVLTLTSILPFGNNFGKSNSLIKSSPLHGKSLHHALPVKTELNKRGVHCAMSCILCNNTNETQDHLFLHCDLARGVWFGADFFIRNLTEAEITVDNWIKDLLQHHNESSNNTSQLQLILTLMWCIWFHRNQVMFEGKQPNPMEIILTSKSLLNRFLQAPSNNAGNTEMGSITAHATSWQPDNNWQVLITTEGGAAKNGKWQGMPYVGKNRDGQVIFVGCKTTTT
uniref:Reverse transcriptase zinc-binding domain-containing protein n=1 Tax=Fagus sylvatica TaxID=28930 RepID=A0A2N9EZ18_FAGSY